MITFKIIRKIGKILRGGAGRKEIFLGTLFGVLLGFIPDFNATVLVTLLLMLLLNANFSFVVLGISLGKLLSLPMAAISFHHGYFVIPNRGLDDMFRTVLWHRRYQHPQENARSRQARDHRKNLREQGFPLPAVDGLWQK